MRKRKKGRKFHREADQRKALLKSLASALIFKEKIETTEARAKELSRYIEKQISRASKKSLANQRYFLRFYSDKTVKKLNELGLRFKERKGGYTRVIKLGPRKSDSSKMAIIELVK